MATTAKKSKVSKKPLVKKTPAKAGKAKFSTSKKTALKAPFLIKSNNKSDFLEQLSSIKKSKPKTKIVAEAPLSLRNNLSLALRSPYRFPLDSHKLAVQSSRIAGMAFVIIGALLTIFHLPFVNAELTQHIQNVSGKTQLASSVSENDGAGINWESSYSFSSEIKVDPSSSNKVYRISVYTANASKIELRRIDSGGKIQLIGFATQNSSTDWSYSWDVSSVPDGSYKVYGVVTNYHGIFNTSRVDVNISSEKSNIEDSSIETTTTSDDLNTTVSDPKFSLSVNNASDLNGLSEIGITVAGAVSVEMYVLPKNATTPRYLGVATIKSRSEWSYLWNTANTPNGDYRLYAVAKLSTGKTNSPYKSVRINNLASSTNEPKPADLIPSNLDTTITKEPALVLAPPPPPSYFETERKIAAVEEELNAQNFTKAMEDLLRLMPSPEEMQSIERKLQGLMSEYDVDINNEIENLKTALRTGDQRQIEIISKRIEDLQNKIIKNSFVFGDEGLLSFVGQRLGQEFNNLTERVVYTERIIRERVGDDVFKDSDGDGICDYDELMIYKTDPFSADTDGDGIPDGVEILNGFDPNDPSSEAVLVFESPQIAGLVRKDILEISSIETVMIERSIDGEETETIPVALIRGRGLPNSFVTLYIFSTPVIVTVKTDAQGNWEYTFDKELEDGEHEIYVGFTDNTGAIVAKSEPLRFIKTAEAFTPIAQGASEISFTKSEPGFMTQNMIMLVMSISIIIIGLILMLLGLHLKTRRIGEHLTEDGLVPST